MTALDDTRMKTAARHIAGELEQVLTELGETAARASAGGVIAGASRFLVSAYGRRAVFNMLAQIADDLLGPELPKGK